MTLALVTAWSYLRRSAVRLANFHFEGERWPFIWLDGFVWGALVGAFGLAFMVGFILVGWEWLS